MRKIWDIHGGVHPPENKTQSLQHAILSAGIPDVLILPLSQHIGAPAEAIVQPGQRVLKGEMIASAKGFVSVPVHAPTSGDVVAIEPHVIPHPSGMSAPCIVIRPDGRDEWIDHRGVADYTALPKSGLLELIRNAGIAGMGGAGFPSAVKLSTREDKPIETLILNGTECEPYITADDILMRERAAEVIAGARILQHLIRPTRETLIGIEDNKPEAIDALRKAAEGTDIDVVVFPTKYPSGGEKQLIQILTGKEVPSGGLPANIGVVCQNVGTCVAIHRAIQFGEPLTSRITTVTGDACGKPGNYEVLLGTPVKHLLALADFNAQQCVRLVMGGPMMGYALADTGVPVVKTSNCILAPTAAELPPPPPAQACIRCGLCAEACPVSLLPQQMYWFARSQELEKLEEHNLFDCIECGACSYACPSNIPLVQYYRASKAEIRKQQLEKVKSEHAKARFEARKVRIEQEEAEKEARRKARLEAARAKAASQNAGDAKADVVQAAIERAKARKAADPAQAAIARAQAAREQQSEQSPREKAEQAVASLRKRIAAAEQKLAVAREQGSDKLDVFESSVAGLREKLAQAQADLDALPADIPAPAPATPAAAPASDAAQAAIERAKAARAAAGDQSPEEKLRQGVASLETRLAKARAKLEALPADDDNVDILKKSVDALEQKLAEARDKLAGETSGT